MKAIKTNRQAKTRHGATTVELAMTAPLLFAMLYGALELGHANMVLNVTEAACYEGARAGIVPGASAAEVIAAADRILQISNIHGASISVTPNNLTQQSATIRVQISVPYNASNDLLPPTFTSFLSFDRACELIREEI